MPRQQPKRGDPVWDESRMPPERHGTIIRILPHDEEVLVRFPLTLDNGKQSVEVRSFTFDDLGYNWTDKFGGLWKLDK